MYIKDQERKLRLEKGIYQIPDPYNGRPISKEENQIALEYYINDDLDCSRQSSNTSDVTSANENGINMKKVKRFKHEASVKHFISFEKIIHRSI